MVTGYNPVVMRTAPTLKALAMNRNYESEITRFMRELLEKKPQIVEEQKKGRALWWDKTADPDAERRDSESKVNQQAYVYQNKV